MAKNEHRVAEMICSIAEITWYIDNDPKMNRYYKSLPRDEDHLKAARKVRGIWRRNLTMVYKKRKESK